jgi:membrane protein required for colicin V production
MTEIKLFLSKPLLTMSIIDIVLAALLLFGIIRGFFKGLFVELASVVALILGIYGAIHFSYFAADLLESKVDWSTKTINIVAFAITFVIIVLAISLAGKALTKLADFVFLGFLNKLAGGVFGGLKIGLILSVLLIVFNKLNNTLPFMEKEDLEESVLYEPVKSLAPMIFPTLIKSETEDLETEDDQA